MSLNTSNNANREQTKKKLDTNGKKHANKLVKKTIQLATNTSSQKLPQICEEVILH